MKKKEVVTFVLWISIIMLFAHVIPQAVIILATPFVYTPSTFNVTGGSIVALSVFKIEDKVIMRANVSDQAESAISTVVLNLTDANAVKKYTETAMTNTTTTCTGTANCFVYEKNYTLLPTDTNGTWIINVTATSADSGTATNGTTFEVQVGNMTVNLTNPDPDVYTDASPLSVTQNTTFVVNATITCKDAGCGNVYGTVRYNASGTNPDTSINTTEGATPFYIVNSTTDWWNISLPYRKNITIDNSLSSDVLTNYQVFINVSYESKMQSDFEDLRFTWYNDTDNTESEVDYWIANNVSSSHADVWIEVPSIAANGYETVYMYYGNSTVSSTSNGTEVFYIFADMETGDLSQWTEAGNNCVIETSVVKQGGYSAKCSGSNTADRAVYYNYTSTVLGNLTGTFIIDGYFRATSTATYAGAAHYFLVGAVQDSMYSVHFHGGNLAYYQGVDYVAWPANAAYSADTWYHIELLMVFSNSSQIGWKDSLAMGTISLKDDDGTTLDSDDYIYRHQPIAGNLVGKNMYIDSYFVRNYTEPPPTYSAGSEEILGNPLSCGSMLEGETCQLNWTVNATGAIDSAYKIGVKFNSSNDGVTGNHTKNATVQIISAAAPYLEVTLINPPSTYSAPQNQTFPVNATVYCRGGSCGTVSGTAMYNSSTSGIDTLIPTSPAIPFHAVEGNQPQTCGAMSEDQLCQLNWTVNATGDQDTAWEIGVNFSSTSGSVADNTTENSTVTITVCTVEITLGWDALDFGSLGPDTLKNANPYSGNANNVTNITNSGSCTLEIWIKGTYLENKTYPIHTIGVGNISWGNESLGHLSYNDAVIKENMTTSYALVKDSLAQSTNVTTYYWLEVPAVYKGIYNGTVTVCGNYTDPC